MSHSQILIRHTLRGKINMRTEKDIERELIDWLVNDLDYEFIKIKNSGDQIFSSNASLVLPLHFTHCTRPVSSTTS